jgi:hypothetical protein
MGKRKRQRQIEDARQGWDSGRYVAVVRRFKAKCITCEFGDPIKKCALALRRCPYIVNFHGWYEHKQPASFCEKCPSGSYVDSGGFVICSSRKCVHE